MPSACCHAMAGVGQASSLSMPIQVPHHLEGICSHFGLACFVLHSLADLDEFIKTAEKGLSQKVEAGDYNGLVEIMGHLLAVKERHGITDAMFEPLKQTIELLKTYEQPLPEEVYQQLEVGETLWWTPRARDVEERLSLRALRDCPRPHSLLEGLSGQY